MGNDQRKVLFGFFAGLAFNLLLSIICVLLLPTVLATVAVVVTSLLALLNLALLNKFVPSYNLGGKVVVGFVGGFLTTLAMMWFMPWMWVGIFLIGEVLAYSAAIVQDVS